MYKFEIGKIMHKIFNNLYSHISKLFVITDQIHSHNTRQITKKTTFCLECTHFKLKNYYTFMVQSYGMKYQNQLKKILSLDSRKN